MNNAVVSVILAVLTVISSSFHGGGVIAKDTESPDANRKAFVETWDRFEEMIEAFSENEEFIEFFNRFNDELPPEIIGRGGDEGPWWHVGDENLHHDHSEHQNPDWPDIPHFGGDDGPWWHIGDNELGLGNDKESDDPITPDIPSFGSDDGPWWHIGEGEKPEDGDPFYG